MDQGVESGSLAGQRGECSQRVRGARRDAAAHGARETGLRKRAS